MLYTINTTIGQEKLVARILESRVKSEHLNVYSILILDTIKGYLFIEADNEATVLKLIKGAPHIKRFLKGGVKIEEIEHLLEPKPLTEGLEIGDIVEITSGAFKGEKAKIIRIDKTKDKVTVEILEATVPIPVTVDASMIRIVKKGE